MPASDLPPRNVLDEYTELNLVIIEPANARQSRGTLSTIDMLPSKFFMLSMMTSFEMVDKLATESMETELHSEY